MITTYYPLLGTQLDARYREFSIGERVEQYPYTTSQELNTYLKKEVETFVASFPEPVIAFGGYFEKRYFYKVSGHFGTQAPRIIHLGIDIWQDAGTPVYAPLAGKIHSVAYNGAAQDYGWCLILETPEVFMLFGHMGSDVSAWKAGDSVERGTKLGSLGDVHENGGWEPHLHLQLIRDMQGWVGDYPGVCTLDDMGFYAENCPDPSELLR